MPVYFLHTDIEFAYSLAELCRALPWRRYSEAYVHVRWSDRGVVLSSSDRLRREALDSLRVLRIAG